VRESFADVRYQTMCLELSNFSPVRTLEIIKLLLLLLPLQGNFVYSFSVANGYFFAEQNLAQFVIPGIMIAASKTFEL
jgi:hypothetical protein